MSLLRSLLTPCRLASVPPEIFSDCTSLFTLSLHNNPITAAALRDLKGFSVFDERRRSKYSKQVRGPVLRETQLTAVKCLYLVAYLHGWQRYQQPIGSAVRHQTVDICRTVHVNELSNTSVLFSCPGHWSSAKLSDSANGCSLTNVLLLQPQMDMHVMAPSAGFDEGADSAQWQHWAPT